MVVEVEPVPEVADGPAMASLTTGVPVALQVAVPVVPVFTVMQVDTVVVVDPCMAAVVAVAIPEVLVAPIQWAQVEAAPTMMAQIRF
jgi:hypothetical protein